MKITHRADRVESAASRILLQTSASSRAPTVFKRPYTRKMRGPMDAEHMESATSFFVKKIKRTIY